MELRRLRYFVTLAEELHFSRAAARLSITQPPLSIAIRALEDEVGVALFDRNKRKVALTHAGTVFLEHARGVIARAAEAIDQARAAQRGEVGRLVVGFMSASVYTVLPPVLREFRAHHPRVRLELRELTLPQQFEALRRGDLHVAFVRPPVNDAAFAYRELLQERLVVALPDKHPLARRGRIGLARLRDEPFVMFQRAPGLVLHHLVLSFCLEHGFTPRVVQEVTQTQGVVGLVSAGIGVALVPEFAREMRAHGVAYCDLVEKSPAVGTGLAWNRLDASPVLQSFVATAARVARDRPGTGAALGRAARRRHRR